MVKITSYSIFFIFLFVYFIPKASVYYYLEKELLNYKIIFSKETVIESAFGVEVNNAVVSYSSINYANIETLDSSLLLIYNSVHMKNIRLSENMNLKLPTYLDDIEITYSIFNPLTIFANAKGEFGEAYIEYNLRDKNISVVLDASTLMLQEYKSTLNTLKTHDNGSYSYDKTF